MLGANGRPGTLKHTESMEALRVENLAGPLKTKKIIRGFILTARDSH